MIIFSFFAIFEVSGLNWTAELRENLFNAKDRHLLDLDKYIFEEDIKAVKNEGGKKNIVESLNKLNELYKSGAITKEEFSKAKDKILN